MRHFRLLAGAAMLACYGLPAMASVVYPTVPVGNAGNAADTSPAGRGAVAFAYDIGKYEVSNSQYVEFLNAVDPNGANALNLFNSGATAAADVKYGIVLNAGNPVGSKYSVKPNGSMTIGGNSFPITYANKPVNYVSFLDAMRFCNWMSNGQGGGSTETGSYTLNGVLVPPTNPSRNADAVWALPSLNEFHKAAYYDGAGGVYYDWATGSNTVPNNPQPPALSLIADPGGSVNFKKGTSTTALFAVTQANATDSTVMYLNDVGDYSLTPSLYGTFDQNGNVAEIVSTAVTTYGLLGGAYSNTTPTSGGLAAGNPVGLTTSLETVTGGFRMVLVPEPVSLSLVALGGLAVLQRRRVR